MSPQAPSTGAKADRARAEFRTILEEKGHSVELARRAAARLEAAFVAGELHRTATLEAMLGDLRVALERDDDGKVGGKSAEAARFILRAMARAIDEA